MKKAGFLKRLFGSRGSSGSSKADRGSNKNTLDKLRDLEHLLQKKQLHLESCIEGQIAEARKQGTKNKRAALMALKRKKRMEAELSRIDGTLTTIEMQREALESAKNNIQVLGAMKDAAHVLKDAQKYVSVDKVLDIMDDVNEQQEIAKEIADAIANPLASLDSSIDDADLERELEELEQEELNQALLQVNSAGLALAQESTEGDDNNDTFSKPKLLAEKKEPKSAEPDPDEKELQELAMWSS